MNVEPKARRVAVIVALTATLAAVYWASGLEDDAAPAVQARAPSPPSARSTGVSETADSEAKGPLDLARLQRAPAAEAGADLFGRPPASIAPPPPPVEEPRVEQVEVPAAPPAPPPLPFRYMGQLAEAERKTVFLAAGDRNLVVGVGDVIDELYRVDEIGADTLMLTYLPLNVQQTLPTGAVQ